MRDDPHDPSAIGRLVAALRRRARLDRHRLTLVLAGSDAWTASVCADHAGDRTLWLSDRQHLAKPRRPLRAAEGLLGTEVDELVYDAHGGLDPDGFGAATGSLRGGGLLWLLTPALSDWPHWPDPQADRIRVHPYRAADLSHHFIRRFALVLATSRGCWILHEGQTPPDVPRVPERPDRPPFAEPGDVATADQRRAVAAIIATARGRARRPLVLTADRGRGKSAALGLAAAELLVDGTPSILVTAPTRRAAETLFRHARARLPEACISGSQIRYQRRTLAFVAPEDLDPASHPAALLLVDEAAAIPVPLLERALTGYPRVVFATTVHGYEGTGRGFEVRFRATLDRSTPNWRALTLTAPIRWAEGDPLESLAARALLLDAEPASSETVADAEVANCRWECLDRQRLLADEASLRELFGLLILAHYQTRPFDLRHLLDGPNVRVYVLRHREAIVATLLTADEGTFDEALSRAIFAGERRPRGHLLPQTLAAHAGLISAPRWRYRRVLRLAVHPAVQRRGLGALALRRLIDDTRADEADLIGASFGATPELLGFWTRCGFAPVHVGTRRNAASGEHALVVLKPVTPAGKALVAEGRQRLARRLPQWLAGPLRMAPARLIARLLAELPDRRPHLDPAEWIELAGFAYEYRSLEASLPVLAELVGARLGEQIRIGRVDLASAEALIATVLQMHEPSTAAARLGLPGRAALLTRLRAAISAIMRP